MCKKEFVWKHTAPRNKLTCHPPNISSSAHTHNLASDNGRSKERSNLQQATASHGNIKNSDSFSTDSELAGFSTVAPDIRATASATTAAAADVTPATSVVHLKEHDLYKPPAQVETTNNKTVILRAAL